MSKAEIAPEKLTLLQHIERIIDLSEENGFEDNFYIKVREHLEYLSIKLNVSPSEVAPPSFFRPWRSAGCYCRKHKMRNYINRRILNFLIRIIF